MGQVTGLAAFSISDESKDSKMWMTSCMVVPEKLPAHLLSNLPLSAIYAGEFVMMRTFLLITIRLTTGSVFNKQQREGGQ